MVLRKYLLVVCILMLGHTVYGQLYVGVKAGVQAFRPFFDKSELRDDLKFVPKLGMNAGFAANVDVKENFSLRFEIAYSQKGKKVKGKIDQLLNHNVVYNHIDFPLLFTRKFDAGGGYQWYINAGPNISYWLSGSGKLETSELRLERDVPRLEYDISFNKEVTFSLDESEAIVQLPNKLQLGLNLGGGLIFKPSANSMLVVDARFEMGSTFLGKKDSEVQYAFDLFDYYDNLRLVNGGLKLSVSYMIDLNLAELKKGKSTRKNK